MRILLSAENATNRIAVSMLALGLSLGTVVCWASGDIAALSPLRPKPSNTEEARAIAEIERLGGAVTLIEEYPGKPVKSGTWSIDLSDADVTDTELARLRLQTLPKLEQLSLTATNVTNAGVEHLRGLNRLHSLDLSGTKVSDSGLVHLGGLTGLDILGLGGTAITDAGLVHLTRLTRLRAVDLGMTKVTDAGLARLASLPELRALYLEGTHVTDAGTAHLGRLTQLRELNLSDTQVTNGGLAHLKGLRRLELLLLLRTGVTEVGIQDFQRALPRCYVRDRDHSPAYSAVTPSVQHLKAIAEIEREMPDRVTIVPGKAAATE